MTNKFISSKNILKMLTNFNRLSTQIFYCLIYMLIMAELTSSSCDSGSKGDALANKDEVARYDHYRIYSVQLETEQHVEVLKKLEQESDSLSFMGHAREVGQKLSILVAAHKVASFVDLLKTYNIKYEVLTYNFQEKIDKNLQQILPIGTPLTKFDWQHYFHLETIYDWLQHLAQQNAEFVTLLDMGTSTQGLPIKGLKIARHANKKSIFIESGIHAREWIAPATATYIINQLINPPNADIKALTENYNWLIFPSVNPDGYKYSFEHDRMWRKNRQLFDICRGVDLNRNYPDHWNTTGSSSNPCHYDYAGPAAASEVETQRLLKFVQDNLQTEQIKTYISLHSYSQMIMFPHGYSREHVPNYADLKEFGEKAAAAIKELSGKDYTSGCLIETIYPSSGDSMDWAYSQGIPIAYTFELRGPPDSRDMFVLSAEEIEPTAAEAFAAIRTIVAEATAKGYYN